MLQLHKHFETFSVAGTQAGTREEIPARRHTHAHSAEWLCSDNNGITQAGPPIKVVLFFFTFGSQSGDDFARRSCRVIFLLISFQIKKSSLPKV